MTVRAAVSHRHVIEVIEKAEALGTDGVIQTQ